MITIHLSIIKESIMKKRIALTAAVCMSVGMLQVPVFAADSAVESVAEAMDNSAYIEKIQGSYVELFPEFSSDEWNDVWIEDIMAVMGCDEETAESTLEMLLPMYMCDLYGEEAVEAYGDMSQGFGFDCYFIDDVAEFTVDGNEISGVDEDGNEIFRHSYHYVDDVEYAEYEGMFFHLYESDDADSGAFTYFAFCDDSPEETYHIEFRYGEEMEGITSYYTGSYAFWLAAGIPSDYSDELMENCIELFATENLSGEE